MTFITLEGLRRFWQNVSQRANAIYTAASSDGVSYTVTIPGITELKHGKSYSERESVGRARHSASAYVQQCGFCDTEPCDLLFRRQTAAPDV